MGSKIGNSVLSIPEDICTPNKASDETVCYSQAKVNQSPLTAFGSPLSSPSKKQEATLSVSRFPNIEADVKETDKYAHEKKKEHEEHVDEVVIIKDTPSSRLVPISHVTKEGQEKEIKSDMEINANNSPDVGPEKMLTAAQKRAIREAKETEEEKAIVEKLAAEKERKRLLEETEARREQEAIAGRISLRERLAAAANIAPGRIEEEDVDKKNEQEETRKRELAQETIEKQKFEEGKEKKAKAAQEIMSEIKQRVYHKNADDGVSRGLTDVVKTETELEKRVRMVKEAAMAKTLAEMSIYSSSTEVATAVVPAAPYDSINVTKSETSFTEKVGRPDEALTIDTSPAILSSFEKLVTSPVLISQPLSGLEGSMKNVTFSDTGDALDGGGGVICDGFDSNLGSQQSVSLSVDAANDDNGSVTSIGTTITATSAVQYHGSVVIKTRKEKKIKSTTVMEL